MGELPNVLISDYVFPLNRFGKMGTIHSVFEHSFNIHVGEHLINIANYHEYLSSFGVFVSEERYREFQGVIRQGDVVKMATTSLSVYTRSKVLIVDLEPYVLKSLKVASNSLDRKTVQCLIEVLEEENVAAGIGLDLNGESKEKFRMLMAELITHSNQEAWIDLCKYMIGRGKGLTPSGDDIITAYLFMMSAFCPDRAKALKDVLNQTPLSTTDISKNYLSAMTEGYVSSPIFKLYSDLKNRATKEELWDDILKLRKIGHTSGTDMSYGILLAAYYLEAAESPH